MSYKRALWRSGLTYSQTCRQCHTQISYMDNVLDFRPWFPDGFVYCPTCQTPLRHNEAYAINRPASYPVVNMTNSAVLFCSKCGNAFQSGDNFCAVCGFQPMAAQLIHSLWQRGVRVVLATNPLFPSIATENRIRWAGLTLEDFEYFTTFENSHYSKPNPDYYREILEKLHLSPEECLMVGNDVSEDMVAKDLGMQVFLLTDCLINKENADLSPYPQGSFEQLCAFLSSVFSI